MRYFWEVVVLALILSVVLMLAHPADAARNESLRWTLAEPPTADGFRIYWALTGGPFTGVDVGRVPQNELMEFMHTLEVPDNDVYFYVIAYNAGGESPGSNQICRRDGLPCPPAPPPPPPPPDPVLAKIGGFSLWNAQTDIVEISNFISGHHFGPGCYAIEIRGNKYLRQNKGSIRKYFDGQIPAVNGCENSYAFGWEDGSQPGVWPCADSLTPGFHTLKVEAFNAKNCEGTPVDTKEITFGVGVVPEPSFELGLFSGILALLWLGRRRAVSVR